MKLQHGGYIELSIISWETPDVMLRLTEVDPVLPSGSRTATVKLSFHELGELLFSQGYDLKKIVDEGNPVR